MFLIDDDPSGDRVWSLASVEEVLASQSPYNKKVLLVPPRITECIRKSKPENRREVLKRLYCSVLDEAVALLDQAEWNLSGHSQSTLWWSRLYTLRLRVFGLLSPLEESASQSLILRKYSADQGIAQSFNHALRIAQYDPFRQFRALKYFFEADQWHRSFEGQEKTRTRMPDSYEKARTALTKLVRYDKLKIDMDAKDQTFDPEEKPLQAAIWALYKREFLTKP